MKLARIAGKGIAFIYFLFKFRSVEVAFLFSHYGVDISATKFVKTEGGNLRFKSTGNLLSISSLYLFKHGFQFLLKVLNSDSVKVVSSTSEGLMLDLNRTTIKVSDYSAIATVQEIYLEQLYQFDLSQRTVVLDIGMNLGYASLFFASMKKVDAVYSFEPFTGTFNIAVENFRSNPELSKKIFPFCYGVGNSTGNISVPLLDTGSTVGSTNPEFIKDNTFHSLSTGMIEVQIKSIDLVLEEVRKNHPSTSIVLKIDCEGEEYNIIDQIRATNQWDDVSMILMEWHNLGPDKLIQTLTENKFACINLPRLLGTGLDKCKTGMIYAFKN